MDAKEKSLRQLLGGQTQYVVPLFQRPYSWERKEWSTLWNDILETYLDDPPSGHFLGSIVTKTLEATPGGAARFVVIDGQQRLTTLSILIAALRDKLSEAEPQDRERIDDLCLINRYESGEQRYKILPTQTDRDSFFGVIGNASSINSGGEQPLVQRAYEFFWDSITRSTDDDGDPIEPRDLEPLILDKLEFVSITLGDNDNEHRIFESLNDRGAPLTQADLMRNYFLMQVPLEQQEDLYEGDWLPMQKMLGQKHLVDFFRYQHMSSGQFVRQGDIYQVWRRNLEHLDSQGVADKLRELVGYAHFYKRLIDPENESDTILREQIERLNRWGSQTMYPFALWLYEGADGRGVDQTSLAKVLQFIESYLVRRLFCDIETAGLNRFFMELTQQIPPGDIVQATRQALSQPTLRRRWPDDEEFAKGLLTYPLYEGSRAEQRRLVIETFETDRQHKEPAELQGLTVEHVMPQHLTDEWREVLGENADATHRSLVHTLGNLTLTGYNSELSNKPFREKRVNFADSNVVMNREIAEEASWGPEQIRSRTEQLARRAIEIWPGPLPPELAS